MAQPTGLRVAFVITALDVGGAQIMLLKLLSRIDRRRFEPYVVAVGDDTTMLAGFSKIDVPCEVLGMRALAGALPKLLHLLRLLRSFRPDVVQGWMYHGNLAASAACALGRIHVPVLWNIRASVIDAQHDKRLTRLLVWLGGKLSGSATRILNNSHASAIEHERQFDYVRKRLVIVPNGFDTQHFRPSSEARASVRAELGVASHTVLVGLIARYHGMKDHATFFEAAARVAEHQANVQFVLAGERVDATNAEIARMLRQPSLEGRVHLLGRRGDMERVTAALDIAVSASSSGEGFPNSVGEAMSCGVPCVVTDVGDSAAVVGDTGIVVSPRNGQALAGGINELVHAGAEGRASLGRRARQRVIENFSLETVVRQYEELYMQVHQEHMSRSDAAPLRSAR